MEVIETILDNLDLAALLFIIVGVLTAIKQGLRRWEDVSAPGWLSRVLHVARRALELATANDGQSDS